MSGQKAGARRKHKKQEIRVFVSSTFRDFREEREQIIKKSFREVGVVICTGDYSNKYRWLW